MFPRRTTTYGQGGGQYPSGYQPGVCAYEGQLDNNGNRHGWGRMQFADGNVYEGEWNEGKMHGRGTYVFSDGNRYEGEFENGISTMMKHGKGKLTYTTGDVYQGDFEKGERNGFGRMNYANGNVYEGGWNDGKHHGKGTAMYPKIYEPGGQDVYEGDWINGQRHGWGTCKYANGDVYVGSFDNGKKHGKGTFEYANGNVYQGEFKNSKAHGQGTMKYTGGELYEGEFEAEQRHGKGKMKYGDGREYNGDWKCGNAYGTGRFKWTNGDEYDGGFKEGKFHGRGLMKYGKGGSSDFIYDNGIFVSNEIHTAIFYTKLLALNDTGLEIYESILELPPLVEDVHMMKFLYTLIATCRRMDLLKEEQAIDLIEMGLEKTSETITHEDALVAFMLILEKADNDKLVTRPNYYRFANRGELKRIEHAPFIQSMMQAIQVNLSQAQRIQDLEENVQIINDSVNAVKAGLKRKLRVEAAVGFMSCVLNAISFGVGGSLLSAAQKCAMDSIVDFGDQAHILSTVEKMSGSEADICKQMLNQGKNFVVNKMENDMLKASIRDHNVLVVVAAASQMVSDRDKGAGESGNTDWSNIPDENLDRKEENIVRQAKDGDAALKDGNFAKAITCYTEAICIDVDNHEYISRRSLAYLRIGDNSSALADANWAISLNAKFSTGYYCKGKVLYAMDRYDEAIAVFEEGLERCPNDDVLLQGVENLKTEERFKRQYQDGNQEHFAYGHNSNTNGSYPYPEATAPPLETHSTSEVKDNSPQQQDGPGEDRSSGTETHAEVAEWLLSMLPYLKEKDLAKYCACLVIDGYYSVDVLKELEEDDLIFMKKGHRKALVKKLAQLKGD